MEILKKNICSVAAAILTIVILLGLFDLTQTARAATNLTGPNLIHLSGTVISPNNPAWSFAASGASQSPWLGNIDGGGFNLADAGTVNAVSFTATSTSVASVLPYASTTAITVSGTAYFPGSGIWNSSGNLGIGNVAPSYKLDVAGFVNVDQYSGYKQAGNTILYASSTDGALVIGNNAGKNLLSSSTMTNDIAIGVFTLASASMSGVNDTAVGASALSGNTTGNFNAAFGNQSMQSNTTGSNNTAFGHYSLNANTTGGGNTAVGFSLYSNTTGGSNLSAGTYAMATQTTASNNVGLGFGVLINNITGSNNTAIGGPNGSGFSAERFNTSATSTVAIGDGAGAGIANYNNQGVTLIGANAGTNFQTGSDYNTLIGYQSGNGITTGARNVLLGQATIAASYNQITTGSNNIAIGNDVAVPSATANNQLNIGNLIYGTGLNGTGSTVSTGNIGIGTTSPSAILDANGMIRSVGVNVPSFGAGAEIYYAGNVAYFDGYNRAMGAAIDTNIGQTGQLRVAAGGNVGIGSSSPFANLSVMGGSSYASLAPSTLFAIGSSSAGVATSTLFGIDSAGHVIGSSTSPTLSSCGTSPSVNGDDKHGYITVGSVSASGCTLTFAVAYKSRPTCLVSNESMSVVNALTLSVSTSALTLTQTGLTGNVVDYICQGTPN
jgi:hypothetical protein